jgi:hypothetical protein
MPAVVTKRLLPLRLGHYLLPTAEAVVIPIVGKLGGL